MVAAAGRGDAAAFRTLVDRHLSAVLVVARRMLRDDAEAEDVAQEAMLRMWRSAENLEVGALGRSLLAPRLRRRMRCGRLRDGRVAVLDDEARRRLRGE